MEDMRKAAVAFYRRSDANQQQIAIQFFNQMDTDRNGKISPNEFLEALKQVEYNESKQNELAKLFKKLDSNFDINLDFYEALPFYYLIRHKTALFCSGCSVLLVGKYFSCVDCHVKGGNSYDLCIVCYQKGKVNDDHNHKSPYDNTHLLQIYRNLVANQNANRKGGDSSGSAGLGLGPNIIKEKTTLFCVNVRCRIQLGSIYFSCLECHDMEGSDTYDLFIDCYDDRASDDHMHKSLCENNFLFQSYRQPVANWKENKEDTHVTSREQKAGVGIRQVVGTTLLVVGIANLASHFVKKPSVTGSHSSTTRGGDSIGCSTSGPAQDGDALGSADPSLAQHGCSLPDVADQGTSLADFADQGSSLADFADQGSSLADIADQGSSLADAAQQGLGFADAAQQGLGLLADATQNVSDLVDVATTILTACSIM